MEGLVEYASSDDENASEQPVKESTSSFREHAQDFSRSGSDSPSQGDGASASQEGTSALNGAHRVLGPDNDAHGPVEAPLGPTIGPAPGPAAAPPSEQKASANASRQSSPYTSQLRQVHNLTLPPIPNVSIPPSPPGSPRPSASAKIEQFLKLKSNGIHFNEKLANSSALRNPSLLASLIEFAGIDEEAQYASSLPGDLALGPERFDEWAFVENINQEIAKREKKRKEARTGLDFVHSTSR